MATSLYVHIPFCSKICSYCDFSKVLFNEKWAFSYVDRLIEEISSYHIEPHSQKTIYIGGGTPTQLPDILFSKLLAYLKDYLAEDGEFSVEANPDSLTKSKAFLMKKHGVNRVSIGVQSANPKYLELMDRTHDFEDVKANVENLRRYGITNINVDLIYALPNETKEEVLNDVFSLLSLDVPHISTYSLILEEATVFKSKGYKEADQEVIAEQYEAILKTLRDNGYERYEVSNYAKPGYESKHNTVYWKNEEYYGVGLGASGYLNGVRYKNTKSMTKYLKGTTICEEEKVEDKDKPLYFLMTNLRLKEGFKIEDYEAYTGKNFDETLGNKVDKLIKTGLLVKESGRVYVTDKGMLLLDKVTVDLLD